MKPTFRPLDRTDLALTGALANDGRLSNKELAARVDLAPSSAHARVQRLFEEGIVRGVHAELDLDRLGAGLQAMISLRLDLSTTPLEAFADRAIDLHEVLEVYQVSGTEDLLLHVAVPDSEALRRLVMERLAELGDLRQVVTSIVFRHLRSHALPLQEDEPRPRGRAPAS